MVQNWYESRQVAGGKVPENPMHAFFLSPQRYRQEVDLKKVFDRNDLPDQAELNKSLPKEPRWDAKADDVWAFGCTTFYLLSGEYPFNTVHVQPRALLQAFGMDFLQRNVQLQGFSQGARDFLLWILKTKQSERPTIHEVLNHPWLRSTHPSSPHLQDYLSTDASVYGRSFNRVPGHISENLVRQMAANGYSIQYQLGEGSFGAVYK